MSGFEVTGVVLGSIPLVISALEHYAQGVSSIKRMIKYRWELKELIIALQTQYGIYRNTCEQLLDGLVSAPMLEELVKDSDSPLWQDPSLNEKLRERLNTSYDNYLMLLKSLDATIEEFKRRLDLGKDGKVRRLPSLRCLNDDCLPLPNRSSGPKAKI
jgi:hypothetical protein